MYFHKRRLYPIARFFVTALIFAAMIFNALASAVGSVAASGPDPLNDDSAPAEGDIPPALQDSIDEALRPVYGGGGPLTEDKKLTPFPGNIRDQFGYSVSISGDTAVVGMPYDDTYFYDDVGAVFVFERDLGGADNWGVVKKFSTTVDASNDDLFGFSVAISGDILLVGIPGDVVDAGRVSFYYRNQGGADNWGLKKSTFPGDFGIGDLYGWSVALDGDTAVIGARGDDSGRGSAYVLYQNQGGADNWGQVDKLYASDGVAGDTFGDAVAIDGDTVIVGAPGEDNTNGINAGSAYLFYRDLGGADTWGQARKILAAPGGPYNWFGDAVDIDVDTALVGAPNRSSATGSAYAFLRDQGGADNWGQVAQLDASDAATGDWFGLSVAVSKNSAVIGARGDDDDGTNSGSGYVFYRNKGGFDAWEQLIKLNASTGSWGDFLGFSVALDGSTALVGAPEDQSPGANPGAGAAYIFSLPAAISNFVWADLDADGIQDPGEPGLEGVSVSLYNAAIASPEHPDPNGLVWTYLTASDGSYLHHYNAGGNYFLIFEEPANYTISPQDVGGNDAIDSDADAVGVVDIFTLADGEDKDTVDVGMIPKAKIGDWVWEDLDNDGIQDVGESGIAGVTVELYKIGLGLYASTTTAVDGSYSFANVEPGTYYLKFYTPAGYYFSPKDVGGDDAKDSDANTSTGLTATTTLSPGETDNTWDAGMYQKASISDFVWKDLDGDGVQDGGETGIGGVTVELYSGTNALLNTTATAGDGSYSFTGLNPGDYYVKFYLPANYYFSPQDQGVDDTTDSDADAITGKTAATTLTSGENDDTWDAGMYQLGSISDFVWVDLDADGIQDVGEVGLGGVTVNLYDTSLTVPEKMNFPQINALVDTTTTAGDGSYSFTGLAPGSYFIQFIAPSGNYFSPQDQGGNDAKDSDAAASGLTDIFALTSGQSDTSRDAGLYQLATLGDWVWHDLDEDGIQDGGELGIAGVTVELYEKGVGLADTTTTASDGSYSFTGVQPTNYYLVFYTPSGYLFSPADQGGDDSLDSDANIISGTTDVTTLTSGEVDDTWDAGMYLKDYLLNGGFEDPLGAEWEEVISGNGDGRTAFGSAYEGSYIYLFQADGGLEIIRQTVVLAGVAGDEYTLTFRFGGMGMSMSGNLGARLILKNGGATVDLKTCVFSPPAADFSWTEFTCTITATGAFDSIQVLIGIQNVPSGMIGVDAAILNKTGP